MKIAYLQPPYPDGKSTNPQSVVDWMLNEAEVARDDTDLVVLPEYANCPGINDYEELVRFIHHEGRAFVDRLRSLARDKKICIAANVIRQAVDGLQNLTVLLNRNGEAIAEYQKIHLTEFERQALQMIPGNCPQLVEVDGARITFASCFDIYFAEYFEKLGSLHPDIIIIPSYQRSEKHHVILAQTAARAIDAGAFIVRSSYSMGAESNTGGMSMLVHPDGRILNNAEQETGIFYAEINPQEKWLRSKSFGQPAVPAREIIENNRRPEIYMTSKVLLPKAYPRAVAHRGFSKACPENTLPAFGAAVALGADEIELDVWPSADGELVVIHDPDLHRTTDGVGTVMNLPWTDIAKVDAGIKWGEQWRAVHIPRLEEVWEAFGGQIEFNIHVKDPGEDGLVIRKIQQLAEKYGIADQIYIAGMNDVMVQSLRLAPDLARCCLTGQNTWRLVDKGIEYQCGRVQFSNKYCDEEHIQKAHDAGIIGNLFYADDPDEAARYLEMGIDSILTNALAEVLPVVKGNQAT